LLGQQFFANKKYQEFLNSNFILFRATRGEKIGDAVYEKFNIRATPTVLILDHDGSEVDWHVGYGPPPSKFLERVEKTVKGIDTFKVLSDKYAKDPKDVEVVFKLGQKYNRRYDQEKATKLYKEVLALDPDGKQGTTDYNEEQVTYTEYAEFSLATITMRDRTKGPADLKAFIEKYSESPLKKNAYSYIGSYYRSAGSKEEATEFFEKYVSLYPEEPSALNAYVGRIIRNKDNLDRGIELAEKVLDLMKYNPDPYYTKNLAELYALKGDKDKVEEVYGKDFMEGKVSDLAYDLRTYADFWVKQKENLESAENLMMLAVQLKPDNTYFIQAAARMYVQLEKPEKALELYGPGFIKDSDKPDDLSTYAYFWAGQNKNLESALEAAQKAVTSAPSPYGFSALSRVYLKLKEYDKSLEAAEKAAELSPKSRAAYYQRRVETLKKTIAIEKNKEKEK
jgi:tetratricopeptide (TPR) repeat protein